MFQWGGGVGNKIVGKSDDNQKVICCNLFDIIFGSVKEFYAFLILTFRGILCLFEVGFALNRAYNTVSIDLS
jgi:hypothetical protein